jgi:hypothetical protein
LAVSGFERLVARAELLQQPNSPAVAWIEFHRKVGQFDAQVLRDVRAALASWLGA